MNEIENIDELIRKIYKGELLSMKEFNKVFFKAKEISDKRENIAILKTPLIICGCINAHFEELKDIFKNMRKYIRNQIFIFRKLCRKRLEWIINLYAINIIFN